MQELLSGENYIITLFLSTKTSCALTCNKIIQPKSHLSRMKKIRELKKKKRRTQLRTHLFPFQILLLPTKQKITSTILGE